MVNSFSKYYAMTGWRLGWLLVPAELRRAVDCLTGNFTICPPVLPQYAAVAAFTPEAIAEAEGHLHQYALNRETLLRRLRQIGIARLAPTDGAFYVYADVSDFTSDSLRVLRDAVGRHRFGDRPRASTSTPCAAARSCGCRSPGRPPTSTRRCADWGPG